jgi:hypothetical protein
MWLVLGLTDADGLARKQATVIAGLGVDEDAFFEKSPVYDRRRGFGAGLGHKVHVDLLRGERLSQGRG